MLWPEQKILLVCRKGFGDFFKYTGLVDHVFEVKKGDAKSYRQALQNIKQHNIEHLISPHESWRTAFFCQKIKAKRKITFKKFIKGFFFDDLIVCDYRLPDPLRQMSLLENLDPKLKTLISEYIQSGKPYAVADSGHLSATPEWASMGLRTQFISDLKSFESVQKKYSLEHLEFKKVILMFPGSVWATKRWTESGFIQTGQDLKSQGFEVIVMGGPGEEVLSERVAAQIKGSLCLAGKTSIYESALVIAHASLVIGNDSAASHMASMCETPLIAMFGPTILEFGYRPWSSKAYVLETRGLKCRPCGKHGHKECPIGTLICMKEISPERVTKKAIEVLTK